MVNFRALTYGSLGMIVGHEITHGFDKQGKIVNEFGHGLGCNRWPDG